ncbi:MAG: hypothetical protein A6F71_04085 [Cycloclasticus sp. symbiont of Poecilosclerida sp. M]|nr:MAG: hypothetical protein A6F71_04085 [Cycloclasticus sp. symbiont of Poecilosclerida sp. M]
MDFYYIFAGASVGFIIGLTGVGGGSLMTPLLVLGFNVQPAIAVGTDLLYAAITKAGGVWSHHKHRNIDWTIVRPLCLGSIPGSIICVILIQYFNISGDYFDKVISISLGFMLVLTSFVILFKNHLSSYLSPAKTNDRKPSSITITLLGAILGILVTLSSVGAGAIGGALLMLLYPSLKTRTIIGTDIAHAVPLTAIAGLGHYHLGNIDFSLLFNLILGSIPGIYLGAMISERVPEQLLRFLLATLLLLIGAKFIT